MLLHALQIKGTVRNARACVCEIYTNVLAKRYGSVLEKSFVLTIF